MANTARKYKFYVCETPQPDDLTLAEYEALTWVQVRSVGQIGERGTSTNVVSYDTLDDDVTQKGKGISNAGDPTLEVARRYDDPGQVALRAMALTNFNYATKEERNDAPDENTTNTVLYNRGLVMGPTRPAQRNEDFDLEVFMFGYNQIEIVADPEAITP